MTLWRGGQPLILASKSTARLSLLVAAGLPVERVAVDVDERAMEREAGEHDPSAVALLLARAKALAGAALSPGRYVVGADQTLAQGRDLFHKPADVAAARAQLKRLSGRTHELHSAVAVARDGEVLFQAAPVAYLTMRHLTEEPLEAYLAATGAHALTSVGAYQLEGLGVHLFEKIEGDHFTILGLPLVPLLAFFRARGLVL